MGLITSVFPNSVSKMSGLAVQAWQHDLEVTVEDRGGGAHL